MAALNRDFLPPPILGLIFASCGKEDLPKLDQDFPRATQAARAFLLNSKREEINHFAALVQGIAKNALNPSALWPFPQAVPCPALPPLPELPVHERFLQHDALLEAHHQTLRFDTAIAIRALKSGAIMALRDVTQPAVCAVIDDAIAVQRKEVAYPTESHLTQDQPCLDRACASTACPQQPVVAVSPTPSKPMMPFKVDALFQLPQHALQRLQQNNDLLTLTTKSGGKLQIKMAHEKLQKKIPALPLGDLPPQALDINTLT